MNVSLLPMPKAFTPEEASSWLQDDLDDWLALVQTGFYIADAKLRDEFACLLIDVRGVATACLTAIREQRGVEFETHDSGDCDFGEEVKALAYILTAIGENEWCDCRSSWGFAELARGLRERLVAEGARG